MLVVVLAGTVLIQAGMVWTLVSGSDPEDGSLRLTALRVITTLGMLSVQVAVVCVPLGEHRWLTVVSPEDPDGPELVLEPDSHPAAKPFKEALVTDGIPFTSFAVNDITAEFERLRALGVRFTQEPVEMGPVTTAVLDDTCGNLVQIAQQA